MMKIYTKTGDAGETSLFSGKRVSKTHALIESVGCLDELNSAIGFLIHSLGEQEILKVAKPRLIACQSEIFSIGSYLASDFSQTDHLVNMDLWTKSFESEMDLMSKELPELKNFILPGGAEQACHAHNCRVLTRAVERKVIGLEEPGRCKFVIIYFNRLSDYFFVLARHLNFKMQVEEPVWKS